MKPTRAPALAQPRSLLRPPLLQLASQCSRSRKFPAKYLTINNTNPHHSDGQVQNPTGKPVQQISDGQVQNPTGNPVQQISDGQVQNPTGAAPGTSKAPTSGGAAPTSAAPYPSTSAGAVRPESSAPADYGNTTNITPAPYEGAASTAGVASLLLCILIGGLAFTL